MPEIAGIALLGLSVFVAVRFAWNWFSYKPVESPRVPVIPEGDWRSFH